MNQKHGSNEENYKNEALTVIDVNTSDAKHQQQQEREENEDVFVSSTPSSPERTRSVSSNSSISVHDAKDEEENEMKVLTIPKHSLVYLDNRLSPRRRGDSVSLPLLQGENWLQLPSDRRGDSLGGGFTSTNNHSGCGGDVSSTSTSTSSDTSGVNDDYSKMIPRILSSNNYSQHQQHKQPQLDLWLLSSTQASILDDNLVQCFLCLDVDGAYLTVKDMRTHVSSTTTNEDEDDSVNASDWTVYLQRGAQKSQRNRTATMSPTNKTTTSNLEDLPLRQLRILYHSDRIILQKPIKTKKANSNATKEAKAKKIVLEYRYDSTSDSQDESTATPMFVMENAIHSDPESMSLKLTTGTHSNKISTLLTEKDSEYAKSIGASEEINDQSMKHEVDPSLSNARLPQFTNTNETESTNTAGDHDFLYRNLRKDNTQDTKTTSGTSETDHVNENEPNQETSRGSGICLLTQPDCDLDSGEPGFDETTQKNASHDELDVNGITDTHGTAQDFRSEYVVDDDDKIEIDHKDDDSTVDPDEPLEESPASIESVEHKKNVNKLVETNNMQSSGDVNLIERRTVIIPQHIIVNKEKIIAVPSEEKNSADTKLISEIVDCIHVDKSLSSNEDRIVTYKPITTDPDLKLNETNVSTGERTPIQSEAESPHQVRIDCESTNMREGSGKQLQMTVDHEDSKSFKMTNRSPDDQNLAFGFSECLLSPSIPETSNNITVLSGLQIDLSDRMDAARDDSDSAINRDIESKLNATHRTSEQSTTDANAKTVPVPASHFENKSDINLEDKSSKGTHFTDQKDANMSRDKESTVPIDAGATDTIMGSNVNHEAANQPVVDTENGEKLSMDEESYEDSLTLVKLAEMEIAKNYNNIGHEETACKVRDSVECVVKTGIHKADSDEILSEKNDSTEKHVVKDSAFNTLSLSVDVVKVETPHHIEISDNKKIDTEINEDQPACTDDANARIFREDQQARKLETTSTDLGVKTDTTQHPNISDCSGESKISNDADPEIIATTENVNLTKHTDDSKVSSDIPSSKQENDDCNISKSLKENSERKSRVEQVASSEPETTRNQANDRLTPDEEENSRLKCSDVTSSTRSSSRKRSRLEESDGCDASDRGVTISRRGRGNQESSLKDAKSRNTPRRAVNVEKEQMCLTPCATTEKLSEPASTTSRRTTRKRKTKGDVSGTKDVVGETSTVRKRSRNTPKQDKMIEEEEEIQSTEHPVVRLVVTGVELTQSEKRMLKKINGVLLDNVEDCWKATHVIVSDGTTSIRRTPKLMIGLCRTPNIVHSEWLHRSAAAGTALPCDDFLVLDDTKAEMQYIFSMRTTINRIMSKIKNESFVLSGWAVYVCNGVAGNKAPPEKELRLIVEAAGGTWIPSIAAVPAGSIEPSKTIIITNDPESKKQVSERGVSAMLAKGAKKETTTWFFHTMMTQQLKF